MDKFRCTKTVEAFQINEIEIIPQPQDGLRDAILHPVDKGVGAKVMSGLWMERHQPEVGGYFVRYKDGYESYSPAEAFEEGYKPVAVRKSAAAAKEK